MNSGDDVLRSKAPSLMMSIVAKFNVATIFMGLPFTFHVLDVFCNALC